MCADCYAERMKEMIKNIPAEWGGATMEQMQNLLDMIQNAATDANGSPLQIDIEVEESPNGQMFKTVFTPSGSVNQGTDERREDEAAPPWEKVRNRQSAILKRRRGELLKKLDASMSCEDYESCAQIRDQIAEINDQLVQLNDERKAPHGV